MDTEVMNAYETLNLTIEPSEIYDIVHVDGVKKETFAAAVMKYEEGLLETMHIAEKVKNVDKNQGNLLEKNAKTQSSIKFQGFKYLFTQVLDIEHQVLWFEVQIEAGETFDDIKKSFEVLQNKLRAIPIKADRKKFQNLRQMTIRDIFS